MNAYDLVFLGSAYHDADLAEPVKIFLDELRISPGLKWAGRYVESFEQVSAEKRIDLLGYFHCQVAPIPPIAEFIHNEIILDEQEWGDYISKVQLNPNSADLEEEKAFTEEV